MSAFEMADAVRRSLASAADPLRAPGQQAYMKSALPFLGVTVPEARRIARAAATGAHDDDIRGAARLLWDGATHREHWYAAMALLARATPGLALVEEIERMVRAAAWWDVTDELAHRLADLHDAFPAATAALVRHWSTDPDLWIRRVAILSQLGRRERLDPALLADVVGPNLADQEFFIRKAIGWALREYARVDPDWVTAYVRTREVSALTRREALKHL